MRRRSRRTLCSTPSSRQDQTLHKEPEFRAASRRQNRCLVSPFGHSMTAIVSPFASWRVPSWTGSPQNRQVRSVPHSAHQIFSSLFSLSQFGQFQVIGEFSPPALAISCTNLVETRPAHLAASRDHVLTDLVANARAFWSGVDIERGEARLVGAYGAGSSCSDSSRLTR